MPNPWGHAKDFFQKSLKDGGHNRDRNLTQFSNPSNSKPKVNDLLIFDGHIFNSYGHVAIISDVSDDAVEIIQQNAGHTGSTRESIPLTHKNGKWEMDHSRVLGWLRK